MNNTNTEFVNPTINLVNLTSHEVTIQGYDGEQITLPAGETTARVVFPENPLPFIRVDGARIPINRESRGLVTGLPAPQPGVVYVTSAKLASAARRPDVMSPGALVRGDDGQPVAARGLTAYASPATTPAATPSVEEISAVVERLHDAAFADESTLDAWDETDDPDETAFGRAHAWARLVLDGHHKYPHPAEAGWAIRAASQAGAFTIDPANAQRLATVYLAIGQAFVSNIPYDDAQ